MAPRILLGLTVLIILLNLAKADDDAPAKAEARKDERRPWHTSLHDGYLEAQRQRRPIFVRVFTESCQWCTKLDGELRKPKLQAELLRWTLVALDGDRLGKEGKNLAVGAVPALRVLTPTGRVMASHEGYLPEAELLGWLRGHYDKAGASAAEELTADKAPTPAAVGRVVAELKNRDPSLREAAIRRLLPFPVLAAPAVADAFAQGPLQVRLAALELLREWNAPIGQLDPWQPETLTVERLKALQKWAVDPNPASVPAAGLTPVQLAEARQDLARLVQAPPVEAAAIRERLARHGAALMPEVYTRLKEAGSDLARERLTALRYRLVASAVLVLDWPGGLERLAATQSAERHRAVQELAVRATAADVPLLLELFSDPDALVREISLRGLHRIAGRQASDALIRLLDDPEPNVRAAVLKQLAEHPTATLVTPIRQYLDKEKDPDLVAHAVRVLRGIDSAAAVNGLKKMLEHESWRVRAEAAEAIGEYLSRNHNLKAENAVDIYAALIERLQDEDGFVISRAVKSLRRAELPAIIEPLVAVAGKHPELGAEIIATLGGVSSLKTQVIPHLRKFCGHANADIRAAAIKQLLEATEGCEAEVRTALNDAAAAVRVATARALLQQMEMSRLNQDDDNPRGQMAEPSGIGGLFSGLKQLVGIKDAKKDAQKDKPDADAALQRIRQGAGRPAWLAGLVTALEPMLVAEGADERVAGAVVLIALAREDKALPVLVRAVEDEARQLEQATSALGWLPWAKRQELYQRLMSFKPAPAGVTAIIQGMSRLPDLRAAPLLWELASRDDLSAEQTGPLVQGLRACYLGNDYRHVRHINGRVDMTASIPESVRKEAVAAAKMRAEKGPELQRLIALAVLMRVSVDDAVALADKIATDDQNPAELRGDAFRALLLLRDRSEGIKAALAGLTHPSPQARRAALHYLLGDLDGTFQWVRGDQLDLDIADRNIFNHPPIGQNQPWVPDVPRGLSEEQVRPFLRDDDPRTVARAGYLLALLHDPAGLDPLVRYWRNRAHDYESWARLVYRAVAALGDDGNVPLLEEIFRLYQVGAYHNVSEFYWTIRIMDGPSALKLRKLIRQEIGMDQLR